MVKKGLYVSSTTWTAALLFMTQKLEHLNQFTVASIKFVVLVWWIFGLHKTIKSDQISMFISLGHLNS